MNFARNILLLVGAILMMGGTQAMAELMSGGLPNSAESSLRMWARADYGTKNSGGNDADVGEAIATWEDSSNAGTDFTAFSSPTLQNITIDGATVKVVGFDGADDYFSAGNVEMHSNTTGMTIFTVANAGSSIKRKMIVSKYTSGGGVVRRQWGLERMDGDEGDFNVQENATSHSWNTHTPFANAPSDWCIVTATWSPGDKPYVYVDGGLAGTATSAVNDISETPARLLLGAEDSNGGALFFEGLLAEVLIYNRALSETEQNKIGYYLGTKYNLDTAYIPEPSTMAILATGLLGMLAYAWRKRK